LLFVDDFPRDHRGDFVFHVLPRSRASDEVDRRLARSARRSSRDLEVFLQGAGFTQTPNLVGIMDAPRAGEVVRGPLTVHGWGIGPDPLRRVTLLFNNGTVRIPATIETRPALARVFPWYAANADRAGFSRTFASRPDGVWQESDLQVELEDPRGRVTRLPQIWFRWDDD
jgi:hypothetical protein